MMTGSVSHGRALIPVTFRLRGQPNLVIEFVVDTGFTGALSMPTAAVAAMGLAYLYPLAANPADGSTVDVSVHDARIRWEGKDLNVPILATGRRPLLGTALLDGHELVVQFRDGGQVTVEALP